MKKLYPLRGIVTVLNTPFSDSGEIDFQSLKRNIREALSAGVAGFLTPAMASEVQKLNFDERLAIVDCALETVEGEVPVFAGTASASLVESQDILRKYVDLGCSHVLIQLPYNSEKQFKQEFKRLAETGPEVIMLQDWDASGYGLPDQLIMDLFESVPAFRCLKVETTPAGSKYSSMLKLSKGNLHVGGGWAVNQMMDGLQRGVHAFMPTGMHWIYSRIFSEFQLGNVQEATALFHKLQPVLAFSNQNLDISIHFFKRLLWKQGIYSSPAVRQPILPFDDVQQELADCHIQEVMEMENRIKREKK